MLPVKLLLSAGTCAAAVFRGVSEQREAVFFAASVAAAHPGIKINKILEDMDYGTTASISTWSNSL